MSAGRLVEIAVRDRSTGRTGTYRCETELLRASMRYFAPAIAQQETELAATPTAPIALKASCELPVFEWLLQWVHFHDELRREGPAVRGTPGSVEAPVMTPGNAVSLLLASTFLQMADLPEEAAWFVRSHLAAIVSSNVDLDCVTGELLAKLSAVVRPADVAHALQRLEQQAHHTHPNRRFVVALLQHLAQDYIGTRAPQTRSVNASPTGDRARSLSWCRLCHALVDQPAWERAKKEASTAVLSPCCPALAPLPTVTASPKMSGEVSGPSFVATPVRLGPRGELYESHAPSAVVSPPQVPVPALTPGSALTVELWSWRVLGAGGYVQCRHCQHLVSWSEALGHHALCTAAVSTTAAYTAQDFIVLGDDDKGGHGLEARAASVRTSSALRADSSSAHAEACPSPAEESRTVLNWVFYAAHHGVYADTETTAATALNGTTSTAGPSSAAADSTGSPRPSSAAAPWLTPLYCTNTEALAKMQAESILMTDVPVPTTALSATTASATGLHKSSAGRTDSSGMPSHRSPPSSPSPAALRQEAAALARSLDAQRLAANRAHVAARLKARYGVESPLLLTWSQLPSTVTKEVMVGSPGTGPVDSDVQTYMERQMMWDMDEWTRRVGVRRVPRVRLSLTTALPAHLVFETSPSIGSPLPNALEVSPRPADRTRGGEMTAATATHASLTSDARRASAVSGSSRQRSSMTGRRREAPAARVGGTKPASADRASVVTGSAGTPPPHPPRAKLASRTSNPYGVSKPAAASGSRQGTARASK